MPPFETRFGLHLGTALVGHFGATDRLNYTAIGDSVNLASRIEGLNKLYGTSIIASESIVAAAGEAFEFRLLDLVAVKGKQRAVRIYELLGGKGSGRSARCDVYESAFALYLARDFAAVVSLLEEADDAPSVMLLTRCRHFLTSPPEPDWDGSYAKEKERIFRGPVLGEARISDVRRPCHSDAFSSSVAALAAFMSPCISASCSTNANARRSKSRW